MKSLLNYAERDLGWLTDSPWAGLDIEASTTSRRRPWSPDELQRLLEAPLHSAYKLPRDPKAGGAAAYWLPLLGMFTGARVGELAQLTVGDIQLVHDTPVLSITDEGPCQQVKTAAAVRKVPIHSTLIRLGFLEYVGAHGNTAHQSLWPDLRMREDKPGGYFSDWFARYRRTLGLGGYPDFHCFRHTVRSLLADKEVAESVIDTIIGHKVKGSTGIRVYTHRSLRTLAAAVERLDLGVHTTRSYEL